MSEKMPDYLNRENREAGICIAGCIGFSDVLLNATKFRNSEAVKEHLQAGNAAFQAALDALCEGLEPDQTRYLLKMASESTLNVVPKSSPRAERQWFPVDENDLDVMLNAGAASDCLWCDKTGKDVKRCELHRMFLRIGLCGTDENIEKGECPFKGFGNA